ncbi:MAG: TetR/AcrR family transcriptional regulator [Lachnospiraceae bacterium]|nr:TetR/AcrR family transcriptional regulator [Lachnospiraceae bacterium]
MNEKFFDLKKEKQDRMINAALKVFALNGYSHASTDDIVAEAGISKGLLFHYFTSKLGLYTFLYDYSVRFMTLELSGCTVGGEDDFFALVQRIENAKLQILKNYPYMQLFIDSVRQEGAPEAVSATEEKRDALAGVREAILERADLSRFRPEADPDKLSRMIEYILQGVMAENFRSGSFQPHRMYEEIGGYLLMLKRLAYK